MKYIVFDTHNGDIHRAANESELTVVYQRLLKTMGTEAAFQEYCVVIRGGDEVKVGLTVQIDDGKKKPVYRGGDVGPH